MDINQAFEQDGWPAKLAKLKAVERRKLWVIADYIIDAYNQEDDLKGREAWNEATRDEKSFLWVAETKGGFFTQAQRAWIQTFR
jgi:hypothetical protein|tara:strand:+ start:509 stop:760 length:252 start_codon:yes stop_codon:yes gene_type:complete